MDGKDTNPQEALPSTPVERVTKEDWDRYKEAGKKLDEIKKEFTHAQQLYALTAEIIQVKYKISKLDRIDQEGIITRVPEGK